MFVTIRVIYILKILMIVTIRVVYILSILMFVTIRVVYILSILRFGKRDNVVEKRRVGKLHQS